LVWEGLAGSFHAGSFLLDELEHHILDTELIDRLAELQRDLQRHVHVE
jgi:hypothetical protein